MFKFVISYYRRGCLDRREQVEADNFGKLEFMLGAYLSRLSERPLSDEKIVITLEKCIS